MGGRHHRSTYRPLILLLVLGIAASRSASWAQNRGICVTSNVPSAFTLPDGSVHAAGKLTLCTLQTLNPVSGLHRAWFDGGSAGLVMSRRDGAEASPDSRPILVFQRSPGTPLDFVGYVLPDGRASWSYSLRGPEQNRFLVPATYVTEWPTEEPVIPRSPDGD